VAEGYDDPYDQGFSDGYNGNRKRNPFPLRSKEAEEYDEGWFEGLGEYEKMNPDLDEGVAEGNQEEKIGGRYDADEFDSMVSRLKNLAGAGPMRTVYDPDRRVYRNMPTAQQPAPQPKKAT
jgi:hypothetical protein